ncbi:MAG: glycosyltransferase [Chitinivibrionales bacterium]|nr:glycosyltransferase [Chitinivibrionales bacterium]
MNIALVNPEYPTISGIDHGGTATYTYTCANALNALGHRVFVLARNGTVPDRLSDATGFIEFRPQPDSRMSWFIDKFRCGDIVWEQAYARGLAATLHRLHEQHRLDIVDIPEYNGLAHECRKSRPFKVTVNFRTPRILIDELNKSSNDTNPHKWHRYEKKAARNADAYRTSSNALKEKAAGYFDIPLSDIAVIRNPVDTSLFDTIKNPERFKKKQINVLFVGRLEQRKGAEIIIKLIRQILGLDDRIHMTFAGETKDRYGMDYQDSIERAIMPEQRNRLWFLGPFKHSRLPVLYHNSDIFLFPSLFDNSPNSLLEAMAGGLPIIAADSGGTNEIISHKKNGLLFSLNDLSSCIRCFREYLDNPACAMSMGDSAWHDCREIYSPGKIASQTIDFYKEIVHN